jgi:hypothetical protein
MRDSIDTCTEELGGRDLTCATCGEEIETNVCIAIDIDVKTPAYDPVGANPFPTVPLVDTRHYHSVNCFLMALVELVRAFPASTVSYGVALLDSALE